MNQYTLVLNEKQAEMLAKACEFYTRMRCGQWQQVINICNDYTQGDITNSIYEAKRHLLIARSKIYPGLYGEGHSYGVGQFRDADMLWEIYEVLRNKIAWTQHPEGGLGVCFDDPFSITGLPMPKCTVTSKKECDPNGKL